MSTLGDIAVSVKADVGGFAAAMRTAHQKLNGVGEAARKASPSLNAFGNALAEAQKKAEGFDVAKGFATSIALQAGVAGAALAGLVGMAVKAASDFNESTNVIQQGFAGLTPVVETWAVDTARAMGRSVGAVRGYAGGLQAMLSPMIGSSEQAARMSTDFAKLAVDLGSFWNVADNDALIALRAGLVGETEPMRKFGVTMTEGTMGAYAFSKGIKTTFSELSEAAKVGLRYQYIMEQTSLAQGDAVRTADGFANSSKALEGAVDDLKVAMGKGLVPAAAELSIGLTGIVRGFTEVNPITQTWIGYVAAATAAALLAASAAAAFGVAIIGIAAAATAANGAVLALAVTMATTLAAAFGSVVAVVAAFTAALWLGGKAMDALGIGMPKGVGYLDALASALDVGTSGWKGFKQVVVDAIFTVIDLLGTFFKMMGPAWSNVVDNAHEAVLRFMQSTDEAATSDAFAARQAANAGGLQSMAKASQLAQQSLVEETSSLEDAANGMSLLTDAARIGADVQVNGALNAADAERKRAAALEKSANAQRAFNEVARKAAAEAAKGALPAGARGVADIMKAFGTSLADVDNKARRSGASSSSVGQVKSDLLKGTIGDLREELESLPFKDFADGLRQATESLIKAGMTLPAVGAFAKAVKRPDNPADPVLRGLAAQRSGLSDSAQAFDDITRIAQDIASDMTTTTADLRKAGATAADLARAGEGFTGLATDQIVRSFNDSARSVDAATQAYSVASEALDGLGVSIDSVSSRMKINPDSLADLVSGGVGSAVDKLVDSLGEPITGADRSSMVDALSGALSKAITGGGIDLEAIGKALGSLIGSSKEGSAAINGIFAPGGALAGMFGAGGAGAAGAGGAAAGAGAGAAGGGAVGIAGGPGGAIIGAAVGAMILAAIPVVIDTISSTVNNLIDAAKLTISAKTLERFENAVGATTDKMLEAFAPFWEAFLPLVGLFDALVAVTLPLIEAFAGTDVGARMLFEIFKFGAVTFGGLILIVGYVQTALLSFVSGVALAQAALLEGLKSFASNFGLGDLIPQHTIDALKGVAEAADAMKPDLDAMGAALVDLSGLTYEEAKVRADDLASRKQTSAELSNVPDGYKVIAARFRAIVAQDASGGVADDRTLSRETAGGGTVNNFFIDRLESYSDDVRSLAAELEQLAERRAFQRIGTTGTRDGQRNGR